MCSSDLVSGLGQARQLIEALRAGTVEYDFVEVMACPGGCISGAGQPIGDQRAKAKRGEGLYMADKMCSVKRSEENPVVNALYAGLLKGKTHELLHVHYGTKR